MAVLRAAVSSEPIWETILSTSIETLPELGIPKVRAVC
jgi:hypothetical protein